MKFPLTSIAFSSLAAFAFSSCSQGWSESQKAQLTTVTLAQTGSKPNAMKPASGIDSPGAANSVPTATGGGLIPALIGHAIDAGVTAHQASQFKKQYGDKIGKVDAGMPKDLTKRLRDSTEKSLRADAFFGPRLQASSPNSFGSEIISYGLERFHRTNDETHLGATLTVHVWLKDASGENLLDQVIAARSISSMSVNELAAQPKASERLFDEAVKTFTAQFTAALDKKLKR